VGFTVSAVGLLLADLLGIYGLILLARVAVDWVAVLSPASGGQLHAQAVRLTHGATEPLLVPLRRVLPPLRLGPVAIDLAFVVLIVAVQLLRDVALRL